jgi:hypothetical protein
VRSGEDGNLNRALRKSFQKQKKDDLESERYASAERERLNMHIPLLPASEDDAAAARLQVIMRFYIYLVSLIMCGCVCVLVKAHLEASDCRCLGREHTPRTNVMKLLVARSLHPPLLLLAPFLPYDPFLSLPPDVHVVSTCGRTSDRL